MRREVGQPLEAELQRRGITLLDLAQVEARGTTKLELY